MSTQPNDDIVRLATADNPAQAHIWEQALLEAGVRCQVVGDYLDAGVGDIPGLKPEVWVRRKDLARAQEVQRQIEAARGNEAEMEEGP